MTNSIKHFMWGYQIYFRINMESRAKSLFRALDDNFDPEIFVVGALVEEQSDRWPACVEPEEDHWIESEAFINVVERARIIVPTYPESAVFHTHPLAQRWHDEGLFKRAIQSV